MNDQSVNNMESIIQITVDDIQPEIEYWKSALVCYILGVIPPFCIIDGFIRLV